ncbi:MAG: efflux RND transporter periplasmic adaptor subunit [Clostridiales bacterium]|jgi:RND family efflux transporter MFP subunit|nr:efflux RND transporter periplasmic adaptor subunit [Clostridiales bacterium]
MEKKSILACALVCAAIVGCASEQTETVQEKIISVRVTPAAIKEIRKDLTYPGQAQPSDQIAVMGKLSGKVNEVFYNVGDYVNAGDVLFTMDDSDILSNIKSLEAQLETAEAAVQAAETGVELASGSAVQAQILQASGGVSQADTGVKQAERNVEQAKLAVDAAQNALEQAGMSVEQREMAIKQAQVALDSAQKNFDNTAILYDGGTIPQVQYDQAETALKNAVFAYEQAQAALEQTRAAVSQGQTSLEQAQNGYNTALIAQEQASKSYAQALESYDITANVAPGESLRRAADALAQAQAQRNSIAVNLESVRENLDDASVTSPISGIVSARNVEPNTMLLGNAAPFTIVRTDVIEARVNVTEAIVNNLEAGQKVTVQISAAGDAEFEGEIVTLAPAASEVTGAFEVRVAIDNAENRIKPGMYAEARFAKERAPNAVVVPRGAVLSEQDGQYVYLAENETARRVKVTTGIDNGVDIEITDGISEGDPVIAKGQSYLKDGSKIQIDEGEDL